jgi:flavin reductase (DIM6/NTAB) family NADH-FMN oxidoreductase RutF
MKKSLDASTILFPAPVLVVGTYNADGKPNVMTASWAGICCSRPPCIAVSLRKATCTHGNIVQRKAFTIGIPPEGFVRQADFFGIVSGRDTDKFAATNLTPVRSELVDAPWVGEFPFVVECRLVHTFELGLHTQFVGEVMDVKADESILSGSGSVDLGSLKPLAFAPDSQGYYAIGRFVGKAFSVGKMG